MAQHRDALKETADEGEYSILILFFNTYSRLLSVLKRGLNHPILLSFFRRKVRRECSVTDCRRRDQKIALESSGGGISESREDCRQPRGRPGRPRKRSDGGRHTTKTTSCCVIGCPNRRA